MPITILVAASCGNPQTLARLLDRAGDLAKARKGGRSQGAPGCTSSIGEDTADVFGVASQTGEYCHWPYWPTGKR